MDSLYPPISPTQLALLRFLSTSLHNSNNSNQSTQHLSIFTLPSPLKTCLSNLFFHHTLTTHMKIYLQSFSLVVTTDGASQGKNKQPFLCIHSLFSVKFILLMSMDKLSIFPPRASSFLLVIHSLEGRNFQADEVEQSLTEECLKMKMECDV